MDHVFLEVSEGTGSLLDLSEHVLDGSRRENVWVVFHIFLGVLIRIQQLELVPAQEKCQSKQEVFLAVVVPGHRVVVLLAFHELATHSAGVLVAHLVYLNGIVPAIERYDELSALIIRLSRDKLSLESQNVHVLLEHLLHVNLRRLRLQ